MYNVKVNINISLTSFIKGVCKFCGTKPNAYYYIHEPYTWLEVRHIMKHHEYIKKTYTKFIFDDYLQKDPSEFTSTSMLKHTVNYNSFDPKQHKNRGQSVNSFTEYLSCDCGETRWAFTFYSAKDKPEITNRKGKYNYPKKIKFKV